MIQAAQAQTNSAVSGTHNIHMAPNRGHAVGQGRLTGTTRRPGHERPVVWARPAACTRLQPRLRMTQAAAAQTDRQSVWDASYTYGPEPRPCCVTRTAQRDDPTAGSRTAGRMGAPTAACTRPQPRLRITQAAKAQTNRHSVWDASYKYGAKLRPCCEGRTVCLHDPTAAGSRTAGRMDTPTGACTRPQPLLQVTQAA